jgi:hypothetical protein
MKDASATPKGICRSWLEIGATASERLLTLAWPFELVSDARDTLKRACFEKSSVAPGMCPKQKR